MHVKKINKPIGKTGYPAGYPVSGNLWISGRISESGQNLGIRYTSSKLVFGTTLDVTMER